MIKTARTHLVRAALAQRAAAVDRAVNLTRLNLQTTVVVHNFEKNQVKEEVFRFLLTIFFVQSWALN